MQQIALVLTCLLLIEIIDFTILEKTVGTIIHISTQNNSPFRSYHNFCLRIVILAIIVEKIRLKVKNANMNHININTFLNKNKSTNFHSDKNNECTRKRVQEDASIVHWNAITAAASGQF